MEVLDAGHAYRLAALDVPIEADDEFHQWFEGADQSLIFVKRVGDKYPGNEDAYPGTTVQDVCRVLIDRLEYVNRQIPHNGNLRSILHLKQIIYELEDRAAENNRLVGEFRQLTYRKLDEIHKLPVCKHCGHIVCKEINQ